jgi:hypothetical protein
MEDGGRPFLVAEPPTLRLQMVVNNWSTNVAAWDEEYTAVARRHRVCQATYHEIHQFEVLAAVSRSFFFTYLSFTGRWTALVVNRPDFRYFPAPMMGGPAPLDCTATRARKSTMAARIFRLQNLMRKAQLSFWGWRGIAMMYPGRTNGAHEECLSAYYYVKHPMAFFSYSTDNQGSPFLTAEGYRRERRRAWDISREVQNQSRMHYISHQVRSTHPFREEMWTHSALALAQQATDNKPLGGAPTLGAAHAQDRRIRPWQQPWVKCAWVETGEALTNLRLNEAQLQEFYRYLFGVGSPNEGHRPERRALRAVENLLALPEPDFFSQGINGAMQRFLSWRQAFASLVMQREGCIERSPLNKGCRIFSLMINPRHTAGVEACVFEVAKFLLAYASDFHTDKPTTQAWIVFIREFQTITIGDVGSAVLDHVHGRPRPMRIRPSESGGSALRGGQPFSGVVPLVEVRGFPTFLCSEVKRRIAAAEQWQRVETALRIVVGWVGIYLINTDPGNANVSSFPLPLPPNKLWAHIHGLTSDLDQDAERLLDQLLKKVLEQVAFIRETGNFPIIDQDLRDTFWQDAYRVTAPLELGSVLTSRFRRLPSRKRRRSTGPRARTPSSVSGGRVRSDGA